MNAPPPPPGPRGGWLLGSLPEFRRDLLGFLTRCARDHGGVASFRLGPRRVVLVSDPDAVEQVLVADNRNFVKHYAARMLRPLLGDGLLTAEGDFWLRQRRLIQPAFSKQRVGAYGAVMVEQARRLAEKWHDGERRDLHADMMRLALGVVARALLGVDADDRFGAVDEALHAILEDFSARFESAFAPPAWLPTPGNLRRRRAVRRLDEVIERIIKQRRASAGGADLLATLVQAHDEQGGMTDRQLRDEVMTLFLAGHETTANALAWTWYLLAGNPRVEEKLVDELRSVLGGRPPAVADLPRLPYTERVVLEAMRLYPPVHTFGREAVRPCTVGGYAVPAGRTIFISQWVIHRDPRHFPDPEAFEPDRWADGLAKRLPKYAYLPFGGGPRLCVGNNFAMMEAVLVVATLAAGFRFTPVPGHPVVPWPSITLRPRHGLPVTVSRR